MLGVKLMMLSVSESRMEPLFRSRSGVWGGMVVLRGRLGVVRDVSLSLLRRLMPFTVRVESVGVGVESLVDGAVDGSAELRFGELSTALMVALALYILWLVV